MKHWGAEGGQEFLPCTGALILNAAHLLPNTHCCLLFPYLICLLLLRGMSFYYEKVHCYLETITNSQGREQESHLCNVSLGSMRKL